MTDKELILSKLTRILDSTEAERVFADVMKRAKLRDITTADDRLAFGKVLVTYGGLFEIIARSIMSQAMLHGAVATLDNLQGRKASSSPPPPKSPNPSTPKTPSKPPSNTDS